MATCTRCNGKGDLLCPNHKAKEETCPTCSGTTYKPGGGNCNNCNEGKIHTKCSICGGEANKKYVKCPACDGTGKS